MSAGLPSVQMLWLGGPPSALERLALADVAWMIARDVSVSFSRRLKPDYLGTS